VADDKEHPAFDRHRHQADLGACLVDALEELAQAGDGEVVGWPVQVEEVLGQGDGGAGKAAGDAPGGRGGREGGEEEDEEGGELHEGGGEVEARG